MHIALFLKVTIESKFCWKKFIFYTVFLGNFFDEQSKFLDRFYWNKTVDHRFIYERKLK